MINKKKVIMLRSDEELLVINQKKEAFKISNRGISKLETRNLDNITANMEITNMNFDELKRYILCDVYFQHIMALDVDEKIKKLANIFIDYHQSIIYGKLYNDPNVEIKDSEFQCITYY